MPSKYASFWKNYFSEYHINDLLNNLRENYKPKEFDVSNIRDIGKRSSWNFVISINESRILKGEAAHLNALAEIMQKYLKLGEVLRLKTRAHGERLILLVYFESPAESGFGRKFARETKVTLPISSGKLDDDLGSEIEIVLFSSKERQGLDILKLPRGFGIYAFFSRGKCIYIGISDDLKRRIGFHFIGNKKISTFRKCLIHKGICSNEASVDNYLKDLFFRYMKLPIEKKEETKEIEAELIRKYQPICNKKHKR